MTAQTIFSQDMADEICERLADGQSLRSICADEHTPGRSTVFRWLAANEAFRSQYARAREAQADAIFDEILDIADDARNDWMARNGIDGDDAGYVLNGEHVQRMRLRIDARKWMAGKLRPKVYGDKIDMTSSDGSMTPKAGIDPSRLSDATLAELAVALNEPVETDKGGSAGD